MAAAGRSLVVGVACVFALVIAPPASAEVSSLELEDGTLTVRGGDGRDVIEIIARRESVTIKDSAGVPSCDGVIAEPTASATCPRDQVDEVVVDLGDGNDRFEGSGKVPFEITGDQGNDVMKGGDAGDLIEGKFGDDTLDGGGGSDELLGGLDDDILSGGDGKDLVDGGPGKDRGDAGDGKDECHGVEKEKKGTCESSQKG